MKKILVTVVLVFIIATHSLGQVSSQYITSQREVLANAKDDSTRLHEYIVLDRAYRFSKVDSTVYYIDQAVALARRMGRPVEIAEALSDKGSVILDSGDIPQAYIYMLQSASVFNTSDRQDRLALRVHGMVENRLGNLFMELGEYNAALLHYRLAVSNYARSTPNYLYNELSNISNVFEMMGQLDSAKIYEQKCQDYIMHDSQSINSVSAEFQGRAGNIEVDLGHFPQALNLYRSGANDAVKHNDLRNLCVLYLNLAQTFGKLDKADSGSYYARKALNVSGLVYMKKTQYQAAAILAGLFKTAGKTDSAYFYLSLSQKIKDELFGPEIFKKLQQLTLREQQRQQQLQEQDEKLKYQYTIIITAGGLAVILLITFIIWRGYRKQKGTSKQLAEQKEEISAQRDQLSETLTELKTTQTQLIQSEKMASLGELTAGIAHEIQNPLNFVNNFSEVSVELLDELVMEAKAGRNEEVIDIAGELTQNLQKIHHHGKRADSIVKGMLEHSRASTGKKEPTDLNQLADEYLRLAYHGLRAKDKNFNAELVTHFDEKLPQVNIIPQDMGRVLLNLFNNAFYAVHQKQKTTGEGYKPTVELSTFTPPLGGWGASIRDNGSGIPDTIKDKIMQPFFTTKPTGEGTGLGLSLSYDIVVKGHGGKIEVDTRENEYTQFTIILPA